jgi:hypothetical protein
MAFNLTDFKGRFSLEGARPTLFEAFIIFPGFPNSDFSFHCKTAQLPGKTLGTVEVPYFGRKIKVQGDQTFADWTVTVMNEENFKVRNAFENWMSRINTTVGNVKTLPSNRYKSQALVNQYNKQNVLLQQYKFEGMWPSDISPIDVSWESNDTIEEFTVTLQYDWWENSVSQNPGALI